MNETKKSQLQRKTLQRNLLIFFHWGGAAIHVEVKWTEDFPSYQCGYFHKGKKKLIKNITVSFNAESFDHFSVGVKSKLHVGFQSTRNHGINSHETQQILSAVCVHLLDFSKRWGEVNFSGGEGDCSIQIWVQLEKSYLDIKLKSTFYHQRSFIKNLKQSSGIH